MKAIQVSQAFEILHQAAYSVSTRVTVRAALKRYATTGNNTVENWQRAKDELQSVSSTEYGGYRKILQIVLWDGFLGNGGPSVPNGTVVDGVVVGGSNYTGMLPNGTKLNIGDSNTGRMGLLNVTGDNAVGIELPPTQENGYTGGPMKSYLTPLDIADQDDSLARVNDGESQKPNDGFADQLYPIPSNSYASLEGNRSFIFSADYVLRFGGLMLGPMMINATLAMISYTLAIYDFPGARALGFCTVVLNAAPLVDIVQDERGLGNTGQTVLVGPATVNSMLRSHCFTESVQ